MPTGVYVRSGRNKKKARKPKIKNKYLREIHKERPLHGISAKNMIALLDTANSKKARSIRAQIEKGELTHITPKEAASFLTYTPTNLNDHLSRSKKPGYEKVLKLPERDSSAKRPRNIPAKKFLRAVGDKYMGHVDYDVARELLSHRYSLSDYRSVQARLSALPKKPSLTKNGMVALSHLHKVLKKEDLVQGAGDHSKEKLLRTFGIDPNRQDVRDTGYTKIRANFRKLIKNGRFLIADFILSQNPTDIERQLGDSHFRIVTTSGSNKLAKPDRSTVWRKNNEAILKFLGIPKSLRVAGQIDKLIDLDAARQIGSAFADLENSGEVPFHFKEDGSVGTEKALILIADKLSKKPEYKKLASLFRLASEHVSVNGKTDESTWHNSPAHFLAELGISKKRPEYSQILNSIRPVDMESMAAIVRPILKEQKPNFHRHPKLHHEGLLRISKELVYQASLHPTSQTQLINFSKNLVTLSRNLKAELNEKVQKAAREGEQKKRPPKNRQLLDKKDEKQTQSAKSKPPMTRKDRIKLIRQRMKLLEREGKMKNGTLKKNS